MQSLPIVAIVGRPNVGKSTLFNRLIGFRQAITSAEAGTTRDRVINKINWNGKSFLLVDTAGFLVDFYGFGEREIEIQSQLQINESLKDAQVVLFVVDGKHGLEASDVEAARRIRKFGKSVILVCNKVETVEKEHVTEDFAKLGFDEIISVSAITGRRIGSLLDLIAGKVARVKPPEEAQIKKIAIVGRPNVGKSTLFNAIAEKDFAIVSEIAGTTRDALRLEIDLKAGPKSEKFEIIDTAGLRRRGRIEVGVEKFSAYRAIDSIMRSHIVLLIVDAAIGLTRQDAHLAQLAIENRKKLIIVLNKIDLLKNQTKEEVKNLDRFKFLLEVPIVAVSAKEGQNLDLLSRLIVGDGGK